MDLFQVNLQLDLQSLVHVLILYWVWGWGAGGGGGGGEQAEKR